MRVVSHPEADEELEAAALWYEERQPGLWSDFLDQFQNALRRIVAEPEQFIGWLACADERGKFPS